jgi:predicted lipoprotein with Yx(FWY)xxD motif
MLAMTRTTPKVTRLGILIFASYAAAGTVISRANPSEHYRAVAMPPQVQVTATELDGPVFADSKGRTLYKWPLHELRNGITGDHAGVSECTGTRMETTSGLMSPYPAGLVLPEVDQHPSCTQVWPPFLAPEQAKSIGSWSIIARKDGTRQWAFNGLPLYTFFLDQRRGDVLGARSDKRGLDAPVLRLPVGPPPDVPPGFAVKTMILGRLLVTEQGFSVYSSDGDTSEHANCTGACAETWIPILGPASVAAHGEWSLVERAPGIKQWAFRNRPLYRYRLDDEAHKYTGSDVAGWHNVYTQRAPPPPAEFTVQETTAGIVLADKRGMTLYTYFCGDDGLDQLPCDHPSESQAYRLAMCGAGDPQRCLSTFPYVVAEGNAKSTSRAWSIITIDPMTGRLAKAGSRGSLRVWAFRDRPVYTYAGDHRAGDINADAHGEYRGERNGFRAFWVRDDFFSWDQPGPG